MTAVSPHLGPLLAPRCRAAAGRTASSATIGAGSPPAGGSSPRWRWRWRAWPARPARRSAPGSSAPSSTPDPPRRPPAAPWTGASSGGPPRAPAPPPGWAAGRTRRPPRCSTALSLARCRTRCLPRSEASCPAAGGGHRDRFHLDKHGNSFLFVCLFVLSSYRAACRLSVFHINHRDTNRC